mmetsp:Transcript_7121/g.18408  ORF Transcript_7121/g.18408 Transcript_7121/m.18408 type:complete len:90 (-) Transcript_7121:3606-3875(-)
MRTFLDVDVVHDFLVLPNIRVGGGGFILLLSARPLVEEGALGEVEAALKRAEAEEERIGEPRSYSLKRVQIDEKGMIGRVQKYSFGKKM